MQVRKVLNLEKSKIVKLPKWGLMITLFNFAFRTTWKTFSIVQFLLSFFAFAALAFGQSAPTNSVSLVKSDEVVNASSTVRQRQVVNSETKPKASTEKPALKIEKSDAVNPVGIGNLTLNLEQMIFLEINQKRAENGLTALVWDEEVAKVARLHSANMAKYNFFSHTGLDGLRVDSRARAVGVSKWHAIGENIAYNRGFKEPDTTAVTGWLSSASHRENLLSSVWRKTGIGVVGTSDGTYYVTQVFIDK